MAQEGGVQGMSAKAGLEHRTYLIGLYVIF